VLVPSAFYAMRLTSATTQEELQRLVDKELMHRLLADSPLNLPRVFVYALYFTFMPGGIIGSVPGMVSTVIMAAVAAWLWLWSTPESSNVFLLFWLGWASLALLVALLWQLIVGVRRYMRGRAFLQPGECRAASLKPGERTEISGDEEDGYACLVQVHERGIYVLSLSVQNADSRVALSFDDNACMVEYEFVPGLVNAACAAYRLESGCHRLAINVRGGANLPVCARFC
jgi:hypothetical protein